MTFSNNRASGKPELLAPAGSIESFFAALENGADAVYAGLRDHSARARARNFSMDEIGRMAALCRREGRRLYVTLNTLVKERELPAIVDAVSGLADARVDALIVADLGVAAIVRDHFPSLPLHASTQMTIHTLDGVRQAAALGFQRAVLARELSLPEIRAVAAASPIELECFIHGALCFCVSGQCLFSSFLGGRSGNRGDCAQPCRWRFEVEGASEYPFSTRDLGGIDAVPALAAAGISCLKIEGRMKPAGYVAVATAAYRKVLDAPPGAIDEARREAKAMLANARGRTGTRGFLVEGAPESLTDTDRQGVVGQSIGVVEAVSATGFTFVPTERFHAGDRLRVMPGNDRKGRTFTVRAVLAAGKEGTAAPAGVRVTVPAPFHFSPGDAVYRTVDAASGALSEAACLRRLAAISPERISCNVSLALAGDVLTVSGTTDDLSCEVAFPVGPLEPARGERAAEALKARFAETGDSPFALAAFDAERFGDRFIPPSRLKEVRRTFYKAFERVVADRREAERQQARAAARVAISTQPRGPGGGAGKIWVGVESPDDVPTLDRPGIEGFLVPLGRAAVGALAESMAPLAAFPERIVWRLPFWMPDDAVAVADAVARLLAAGFRGFEANNPAHFRMLEGKGARVVAGWRTGGTNSLSLRSLRAQGAAAATLSPEDDGVNVEALLRAALPVERWMTVYGRLPMMASRIRVRRAEKRTTLSAEGGERFEVSTEDGLTVLRSASPFSLTGRLARLRAEGCDAFVVELAGLANEARDAVLEAAFADGPMPGASAVNFDREQRA